MHGLQSKWVERAMQPHYQRLPDSDDRIYHALVQWVSSDGDFKFVREQVGAVKKHQGVRPHASSISVTSEGVNHMKRATQDVSSPSGCVPFIGKSLYALSYFIASSTFLLGIYLQQLRRIMQLPDLIDPTSPREPPTQDKTTQFYNPPAHPEVFDTLSPLPASTTLSLLVNVQKQRLIANVAKSLVDGQHLASQVQYGVDRKIYQRCLRLRAMNYERMQLALDQQGL
jgi:GDP/GTP exchange factor required for growth at low temperature